MDGTLKKGFIYTLDLNYVSDNIIKDKVIANIIIGEFIYKTLNKNIYRRGYL